VIRFYDESLDVIQLGKLLFDVINTEHPNVSIVKLMSFRVRSEMNWAIFAFWFGSRRIL